jgi:hypothetical protein
MGFSGELLSPIFPGHAYWPNLGSRPCLPEAFELQSWRRGRVWSPHWRAARAQPAAPGLFFFWKGVINKALKNLHKHPFHVTSGSLVFLFQSYKKGCLEVLGQ